MSTPANVRRAGLTLTLTLAGLSMFGPFNIDAPIPAFNAMGSYFHVGAGTMQQVVSVYLLSFAVMSLVHGPLSDAVGRKPVMLVGVGIYILACIGCFMSTSLWMLLVFRALQGASAGVGQIVSRAVIRDLFDGAEARRLMSQVSLIFGIAPALAPIVGGFIIERGPWENIFWFLAAWGAAMLLAAFLFLPETLAPQDRHELALIPPIKNVISIFGKPSFWFVALAGACGFAGQFLYIANASPFLGKLLHRSPGEFGYFFVPMVGCMMLGNAVSTRVASRITSNRQVMIGLTICALGAVIGLLIAASPIGEAFAAAIVGPCIIAFGNGLSFPIAQLAAIDLFPHSRGAAASASTFVNLIVSASMAGLVGPHVTSSLVAMASAAVAFVLVGCLLWGAHLTLRRRSLATA